MRHPRMAHEQAHSAHFMTCFSASSDAVQLKGVARCIHAAFKHHPMQTVRPCMPFGAVLEQIPAHAVDEPLQPKTWGGGHRPTGATKAIWIGQDETTGARFEQPTPTSAPTNLWGHALPSSGLPASRSCSKHAKADQEKDVVDGHPHPDGDQSPT